MKKLIVITSICVVLLAILGSGYWFYTHNLTWRDYSFKLSGKQVATISYPDKYKDVSDNASLPDQKIGLFSIPNVINFQVSSEPKDKSINTYIEDMQKNTPIPEEGSPPIDISYKKTRYGLNTVYFINSLNSPDFVVGEMFDGRGRRLNFTYHTKNIKKNEIKALISKIKF